MSGSERPIGIFDSGIGGFSVLAEMRRLLPTESITYVADHRFAPYGDRSLDDVANRSVRLSRQLIEAGAKAVVVACNSASAAALHTLRATFPRVPFVGMEPAVKPAALHSVSGVVGVLATRATFQGRLFASVVDRHANGVEVLPIVGAGLARLVEAGDASGPAAKQRVVDLLTPALDAGMDTLVLGCTHYTLLRETIGSVVGDGVAIIDPTRAIARQVGRILEERGLTAPPGSTPELVVATTGDLAGLAVHVARILESGPWEVRRW